MKLDELYKPKIGKRVGSVAQEYYANRHGEFPRDYSEGVIWLSDKLRKLGWTKLGKGGYSLVFENPKKNYVLKVNTSQDKGYDKFVQLIHSVKNKHLPRISDRQTLSFPNKNLPSLTSVYHVYLIEKLQEIPEPYNDNYAVIISAIIDIYKYEINPPDKLMLEILKRDYLQENFDDAYPFIQKNPDLVRAAKLLGNAAKHNRCDNDLHSKNIMQRSDGTIIISDPYVG